MPKKSGPISYGSKKAKSTKPKSTKPKSLKSPKPKSTKSPKPKSAQPSTPITPAQDKIIQLYRDAADTWHDVGKPRSNYKKYSACGDIWPYMIELIDFGTVYHIARALGKNNIIDNSNQLLSPKNTDPSTITKICTEALSTSSGTIEEHTLAKFEKSRKLINVLDIEITTPIICKNAIQSYLNACKILFNKPTFKKQIYFGYDAGIGPLGKIFNKIYVYYRKEVAPLPKDHGLTNEQLRDRFFKWLQLQVKGTPVLCMIKLPANRADSASDQAFPDELTIEEFPTTGQSSRFICTSNMFTKDVYEIFYRKKSNYNTTVNKHCFEYVIRPRNYNQIPVPTRWEYIISYGIDDKTYVTKGPSLAVLIGHFLYKSLIIRPEDILETVSTGCKPGNMLTNKAVFTGFMEKITSQVSYITTSILSYAGLSSSSSAAASSAASSSSAAAASSSSAAASSSSAAAARFQSISLEIMKLSIKPKKGKTIRSAINWQHLFNTDRTEEGESKIEYLDTEKLDQIKAQLPSMLGINSSALHVSKYKNLLHSIHNLGCITNYEKLLADVFQDIKRGGDADQVDQLVAIKAKYADQDVFFTSEDRVCIADALYHGLTTLLISSSSSGNTLQLRNKNEIYSSYQAGGKQTGSELDSCECHDNETISLIDILHIISMKSYDFVSELTALLLNQESKEIEAEKLQIAGKLENTVEYYAQVYNEICESIRSSRHKKIYIYHDGKPKDAELNDYFDTLLSYQVNLNDASLAKISPEIVDRILKTVKEPDSNQDKYVWNKIHEMRDNMEQQITIINKLAKYHTIIRGGADDFEFLMNNAEKTTNALPNEVLRQPAKAAPVNVAKPVRVSRNNSTAIELTPYMVVEASKAHRQHALSAKPAMPALTPRLSVNSLNVSSRQSNASNVNTPNVSPVPSTTSSVNALQVVSPVPSTASNVNAFNFTLPNYTRMNTNLQARNTGRKYVKSRNRTQRFRPYENLQLSSKKMITVSQLNKGNYKKHKTQKHNKRH